MKSKLTKMLGIMLVALFMVSCGGKEETITSKQVKPAGVYGSDAALISIVDDTCTLNKKDGRLRLKVQLKLEKKASNDVQIYPVIVLKDEDGVQIVEGWYQMEMSDSEKSKFATFIKGDVGSVLDFVFINEFNADYFNKALTRSETFSIDKLQIMEKEDDVTTGLESYEKIAKEAAKMMEDYDDEDYEKSLKAAEKSLEAAGKILEMEEDLLDMMDDLDW